MVKPRGPHPWTERLPNMPEIQMAKFAEGRLNMGMITSLDPADIPNGALQLAKNATVRYDKTSRRPGGIALVPAKPNALPVMEFATIKKKDGITHTLRFTPTTIHRISGGVWLNVADANAPGEELAGTITDRYNTAIVFNELVFANNGVNEIQKVDLTAGNFAKLGNAPKYRYICGFFNRVVGAALRGVDETEVGWSGDGNIAEWSGLVDESAGKGPLVESPADLSDFITGLFSWTNMMIVLREKSVWAATKQPIPQFPFNFKAIIPGLGCDCPASAMNVGDGLVWYDRRTSTMYQYSLNGQLETIDDNITREISKNIDDPEKVFSGYHPKHQEYTIFLPAAGTKIVPAWTYNRRGKTWAYNEYYDVTTADDIELGSGGLTIDQLVGTIDELIGTIDELSPSVATLSTRVYGYGEGSGGEEDINRPVDPPHTDHPNGYAYETELMSKVFTLPEDDIYVAEIRVEYQATIGGSFTIEYSRTGGTGLNPWRVAKVVNPNILGIPRIIKYRKMIRARRFAFRIRSAQGLFDTLSYEVHVYKAGKSHK
jgi:hypothetical protein